MRKKISSFVRAGVLFVLRVVLVLACACSPDRLPDSLTGPDGGSSSGGNLRPSTVDLELRLSIRSGESTGGTMLAVARDGTTTDSTNLYIDVEILNLGPEVVYLHPAAKNLPLRVQVSFVDMPYRKNFNHGRLDIVVGMTETGYQATEKIAFSFLADSTLTFEMPISRIDSFRVADNVAVYGSVLAKDRYIIARQVRVFETPSIPAGFAPPDFVGYVQSTDSRAGRLQVSGATVVLTDSTSVLAPNGQFLGLEMLKTGRNRLTVTALAWGYDMFQNMIANGWEFRHYDLYVARPVTP